MLVRRRYWGHNPDLVETYPRRAYLVVRRRYQGITDAPIKWYASGMGGARWVLGCTNVYPVFLGESFANVL
jgi:hypothetical protein